MDTIKKKMLAMKNEKDAAMDRAEQLEQSLKDTETAKTEVRCEISVKNNDSDSPIAINQRVQH